MAFLPVAMDIDGEVFADELYACRLLSHDRSFGSSCKMKMTCITEFNELNA
ncbi:hypothetical protein ACO0LI_00560 [Undibacterium sp. Tian12W]